MSPRIRPLSGRKTTTKKTPPRRRLRRALLRPKRSLLSSKKKAAQLAGIIKKGATKYAVKVKNFTKQELSTLVPVLISTEIAYQILVAGGIIATGGAGLGAFTLAQVGAAVAARHGPVIAAMVAQRLTMAIVSGTSSDRTDAGIEGKYDELGYDEYDYGA